MAMRKTWQPKIVIVGAGYAGIAAARRLARLSQGRYAITLIDQHDYHLLQFALHKVAVGKITPEALVVPLHGLFHGLNVHIDQARVTGFDFTAKTVQADTGPIPYDILIIATGSRTATYGIPGVLKYAYQLKSLEDALRLRAAIETAFVQAARSDLQRARQALTFIVVGAGMTGIELAAEMAEHLPQRAKALGLSRHLVRIILVELAYHVLPGWKARLASDALTALQTLGVELYLGSHVVAVRPDGVILATGEVLQGDTVIWTGGIEAGAEVATSGLPIGERKAIRVDETLAVIGHSDIYAIGDTALIRDPRSGRNVLPSAQLAVQQGEAAAYNIYAVLNGGQPQPYIPRAIGWLVSVGSHNGVGTLGPVPVRGAIARWLKTASELRYLWQLGGLRLMLTHGATLLAGRGPISALPGTYFKPVAP